MKNYNETLKELDILKHERETRIKKVKLQLIKEEINNLEVSLDYRRGRIYPGIDEIESFENDDLYDYFGSDDHDEIERGIKTLKKAFREANVQ